MDELQVDLLRILGLLEQRRAGLSVVGRALTSDEAALLKRVERAAPLVRQAAEALADGGVIPESDATALPVRDGLYDGGNGEFGVVVRFDAGVCGVVSVDVFKMESGRRNYLASLRTAPGGRAGGHEGAWTVVGQDEDGRRATGRLSLRRAAPDSDTLTGSLRVDAPLAGLPLRRDVTFALERASDFLRRIAIETDLEENVAPPAPSRFEGREVNVETAFQEAGFETLVAGRTDLIPSNPAGWSTSQLHTLMQSVAQASLAMRGWDLHLLVLGRPDPREAGLLGIMFDTTDPLPRQGAAVFANEIRGVQGIDHDRKLLQTTVHELGHALNLAHRFERSVGRADSTSFMNYDWRYRGGMRQGEFWSRFRYVFDADELEFLRHGPLPTVIPGGAPFHSINYWADGTGGYTPYYPEVPIPGFELSLRPPPNGAVFEFAQPVFLEVELTNRTGAPQTWPSFLLDPKAGLLELVIKRQTGGGGPTEARAFVPVLQRCFEWSAAGSDRVLDGQSMRNNLNLTYGSGGFSFAEPGTYEVTAVVSIVDERNRMELITRSAPLVIRVATPKNLDEERDSLDFFRHDVGLYLALGGSQGLPNARRTLEELMSRRHARSNAGPADPIVDAVAAALARTLAIDTSREYIALEGGRFVRSPSKPAEGRAMLARLGDQALKTFDRVTAESTRQFAQALDAPGNAPAPP